MPTMPNFRDKLSAPGPKRLLALDGGGIRGILTLEVLARIEAELRDATGKPGLVLADWFDYVAGTSTGAIIATCIALGMPVQRIRDFYRDNGAAMFDRASLLRRFRYRYDDDKLRETLRKVLREQAGTAEDPTLGTEALRTLLLIVMRNATTDSPWPVTNNPRAKYCLPERRKEPGDCNLDIPLWQLVRASTAAPVYFPPEEVKLGPKSFLFVDGGITPYNDPAFLLFLMSTLAPYALEWKAGPDDLLLVSVGTGLCPVADAGLEASDMNLLHNAGSIPSALMYAALNEQDLLCRVFGANRQHDSLPELDREIGNLVQPDARGRPASPHPKLFTYVRYNAELTPQGLARLQLTGVDPEHVRKMDSIEHMDELRRVGEAVARQVRREHFGSFLAAKSGTSAARA